MNHQTYRGILVKWNDEKGFGFIKSKTEDKEIFLHISSIPKESRRPKIGDTITYKLEKESNGKFRANSAFINGALITSSPKKNKKIKHSKNNFVNKLIPLLIFIGVGVMVYKFTPSTSPPTIPLLTKSDCKIKGNISQNSGKKYYHLEAMEDYESTVINPKYGEKWFCTEEEAIRSGWTKAPR